MKFHFRLIEMASDLSFHIILVASRNFHLQLISCKILKGVAFSNGFAGRLKYQTSVSHRWYPIDYDFNVLKLWLSRAYQMQYSTVPAECDS